MAVTYDRKMFIKYVPGRLRRLDDVIPLDVVSSEDRHLNQRCHERFHADEAAFSESSFEQFDLSTFELFERILAGKAQGVVVVEQNEVGHDRSRFQAGVKVA